jgi:hypothetical protein
MRADSSGQRGQTPPNLIKKDDSIQICSQGQFQLNESVMQDREKIIKYNKAFIKKNKTIPPTSLEYYKFIKLIGKGAFGKVTLGVHKLTGR